MPSQKLEFTKQEPAFLRALREQHGGPRNNVQAPRPQKNRLRVGDDDEDEPVIVDETGENVGKEEWEGMLKREKQGVDGVDGQRVNGGKGLLGVEDGGVGKGTGSDGREGQKVAEIGAGKKRKVGKVIVEEDVDEGRDSRTGVDTASRNEGNEPDKKDESTPAPKTKKKAKKIKLSFDDPD